MGSQDLIETGRTVLRTEGEAILRMADELDSNFSKAVDAMFAAKGRVIVSGMGKSGHIGAKIAATLASTGTPAQFVHPGEASHGDLGMITRDDVVLILSNSGETAELADIIAHVRNSKIKMIGVAGNPESTLLRKADIALVLPKAKEACIAGLAPTTSTTMTLALGDALAVTLMDKRDFTQDDYKVFHPGGKLGARLARVEELMHIGDEIPTVSESDPMSDVLITISQKGFGVAAVLNAKDQLSGIITDGDLRRNMDGLLDRLAQDVMTRDPMTITPKSRASAALLAMNDRKITCLFVCEEDQKSPIGILHIHDCLRAGVD
jgi:arabinose-5-phosphate isomerase